MPDNREIAALLWLGAAALWVVSQRKLRESIGDVFKAFFQPLIVIPLAAMFAWIGFELWAGARFGLWNATLAKSTLLWTLGSAGVLFFNCARSASDPHFFRRTIVATVGVVVFVEFFMNLYVLSLPAELVLQFVVIVLSLLVAVGGLQAEHTGEDTLRGPAGHYRSGAVHLHGAADLSGMEPDRRPGTVAGVHAADLAHRRPAAVPLCLELLRRLRRGFPRHQLGDAQPAGALALTARAAVSAAFSDRPGSEKLLVRLKQSGDLPAIASTTRLGDWYGNILGIGTRQHLLFISDRSRLPVIVSIREAKRLSAVFPETVCGRLAVVGVTAADIAAERARMSEMIFGRTRNRSLFGDDERLRVHGTERRPVAGSARNTRGTDELPCRDADPSVERARPIDLTLAAFG